MPFTWLDIVLIVIMLISAILAMMRGFAREVLSIVAWVCAAIGAYLLFEPMLPLAQQYIQPDILAKGVLIGGSFFIILIAISLLVILITEILLESRIGALDRTLGFIFGLARGLLLVAVGFLFFSSLVPQQNYPQWVQNARTMPLLQDTGKMIVEFLPKGMIEDLIGGKKFAGGTKAAPAAKSSPKADLLNQKPKNPITGADKTNDSGYKRGERQGLNQLLESTTGNPQSGNTQSGTVQSGNIQSGTTQ